MKRILQDTSLPGDRQRQERREEAHVRRSQRPNISGAGSVMYCLSDNARCELVHSERGVNTRVPLETEGHLGMGNGFAGHKYPDNLPTFVPRVAKGVLLTCQQVIITA